MTIASLRQLSVTRASNTDLGGINITGSGLVSTADDFDRELGGQIAEWLAEMSYPTVGGSADVLTLTPTTALAALANNVVYTGKIATTNATTTPTMNVSALGAKVIRKISAAGTDVALAVGDMPAGWPAAWVYSTAANSAGGAWILINPAPPSSSSFATNAQAETGTSTTLLVNPANLAALLYAGTDNAGTSTITMGDGRYFNLITSTTSITAFAFTNDAIGRTAKVRFNTIRTLTYDGTALIIPGSASITTAVGDIAQIRSLGSGNFVVEAYTKADGTPVVAPASGQPIPASSSTLGVGTFAWCYNNSAGTIANGSTAAGSALGLATFVVSSMAGAQALSGTWKNISGISMANNNTGYWVRTA
jgi:hypothetical protein